MARIALTLLLAAAPACLAQSGDEPRNWFDDPFFQISSAVADCPLPAGPFIDESDRRAQSHRRAEKGTACWLAKECDRPSAYAYDQDIAASLRRVAAGSDALAGTTLWATVQGRAVYIEGCALQKSAVARIEALARSLPYVLQAVAIVRTDASSAPPYAVRRSP